MADPWSHSPTAPNVPASPTLPACSAPPLRPPRCNPHCPAQRRCQRASSTARKRTPPHQRALLPRQRSLLPFLCKVAAQDQAAVLAAADRVQGSAQSLGHSIREGCRHHQRQLRGSGRAAVWGGWEMEREAGARTEHSRCKHRGWKGLHGVVVGVCSAAGQRYWCVRASIMHG